MINEILDQESVPQSAPRVAARALVMNLVTFRGFIETDAHEFDSFWTEALGWFEGLDLTPEVEPWEARVLRTPLGQLESRDHANAQWLCEGLSILAWALGKIDLPAFDTQVVAGDVGNALGFRRQQTVMDTPTIRSTEEIRAVRESYFAAHWRLREYSLQERPIDFVAFARTAWFGPLSLQGLPLLDSDLAIGGASISKSGESERHIAMSTVRERHRAANWLLGESDVYSETDTST